MNRIRAKLPPELSALISGGEPKLAAPDTVTLETILKAGKGEHQDRLWTLACKNSVNAWTDRLRFAIASIGPEGKRQFSEAMGFDSDEETLFESKVVN